jgi:hypothetical protein
VDDTDADDSRFGMFIRHHFKDRAQAKRRRQGHPDAIDRKIEDHAPPAGRGTIGPAYAAASPHAESLTLPLIEARRADNGVKRGQ